MTSPTRDNVNSESFMRFFEGWMVRQEQYFHELISAQNHSPQLRDDELKELISRVLCHYEQYLTEKSKIAQHDIFLVFNPSWFTTSERAYLWVGGFKPGMAFRYVTSSVDDLSEEQSRRMNVLKQETKKEERAINDELAKIQESVAEPPIIEKGKLQGRKILEGEETEGENGGLDILKSELGMLMENADALRTNTALRVIEILRPPQAVKFLAAVAQLQLNLRAEDSERNVERQKGGGG